ncbi:MAG: EAL domain-containing protein [Treponema sp.]|nr:EAL domain-containing protein [Treponema sp.]
MLKNFFGLTETLSSLPLLQAIRNAMLRILPLLIIGYIAQAIVEFPINAYQSFIHTFAHSVILSIFSQIAFVTQGLMGVYFSFCVSICISEQKKTSRHGTYAAAAVSTICFMTMSGMANADQVIEAMQNSNLFIALLCSAITTELYLFVRKHMVLLSKKHKNFDVVQNQSMKELFAMAFVISIIVIAEYVLYSIIEAFHIENPLLALYHALFKNKTVNFGAMILYTVSVHFCWFFGIQGTTVMAPLYNSYLLPAAFANQAALLMKSEPVNMFTSYFYTFITVGGSGIGISMLIALLLFSKQPSIRLTTKTSLVPTIFNFNEPLLYGLPVMLNPILFVPFLITPIINTTICTLVFYMKWVPLPAHYVPFATPPLISGYLITGSISGTILQILCITIGVLIYKPFIAVHDTYMLNTQLREMNELVSIYKEAEAQVKDITLTNLPGIPGVLSRFLAHDLAEAVSNKELKLVYQPQFDNNMKIFGAEALLRWNHPVFGEIYPPLVIKLASETNQLTNLEETIFLLAQLDIAGHPDFKYSINVTPTTLRNVHFIDYVLRLYTDLLLDDYNIFIEVTEQNALITDELMLKNLDRLKKAGFGLAIDDFSMGHTSLNYLQEHKFDLVKLDGTFSKQLLKNENTKKIIDSIVYLSKTAGFKVLAEYVETDAQKLELEGLGCTQYQGYLCSPALSFSDLFKKYSNTL